MTMFLLVENEKGIKDIEMIDNERDKKLEVKIAERLVMNGTYKGFWLYEFDGEINAVDINMIFREVLLFNSSAALWAICRKVSSFDATDRPISLFM